MRKFFNMIEVTLAIAVVGLGMTGIMALFPVGFQASRDSIGDNYSADAGEQFLSYLGRTCQTNWTTLIHDGTTDGTILSTPPTIGPTDTLVPTTGRISDTNLFLSGYGSNIFCIKQPATGNPDFTAHIKVWKSPITNMNIGGASGISIPYYDAVYNIGAARLNVEISWPVEKPYTAREKRFFCLELFKQND